MSYADIIRIRAGKPAYNIIEEKDKEWASFIANEQFNNVLKTVIRSVRGDDIDSHKSFWINGTYGTGKSHAVSVITHLLGDSLNDIRDWVEDEYAENDLLLIKDALYSLRKSKRLFPVRIKGLENLTHVSELSPLIQTKVIESLNMHDIEIDVDTDYDNLIKHIEGNPVIWDDLIKRTDELSSIVADCKMLLHKLKGKDPATLQKARIAQRKAGIMVTLHQQSLGTWLIEVQEKLRKETDYTGILILWDEFTEVMDDAVGIPVLRALQAISEIFMNEDNDSFIFLISHPSAFNKLGKEATKQTDGRYHRMKYNMESVSAFKIMSRKLEIIDKEEHKLRCQHFYNQNSNLIDLYTEKSNDKQETRNNLLKLFPIHPGTANLATHYATTVGSSSRSMFEFIGDNEAMRDFFNSEQAFENKDTITADFLWDFVLKEFQDDVTNYGAVTERFNTYKHRVFHQGEATTAIFKAILLLNAFNNVAADDSVTPTENNIRNLFVGTRYENDIDKVLNWINDEEVIHKAPGGVFSVQFSSLPSHELEEIKEKLCYSDYRFTYQILQFGDTANNYIDKKYIQKSIRQYSYDYYSNDINDSILKNRIKSNKKNSSTSNLYLALFFSRNRAELNHLQQLAEEMSKAALEEDRDFCDVVFIVFETVFEDKNYNRFIEYMASYTSAGNHGFMDQVNVHRGNAINMIDDWMKAVLRGNATIWINSHELPSTPVRHLSTSLNDIVSPIIFPKGPESLENLRSKASTFWRPQVSKDIIRKFISARNKTDLLDVNGVMTPIQYLVQDALNEDLEWKSDIPEGHPLKEVYIFINSTIQNFISYGKTSTLFDFIERFRDLTKPPFGLSNNYASEAMFAFAMRPWVDKIYNDLGKPRSADNLVNDIAELFTCWEKGKKTSKLSFKFQTPEEGKLYKELVKLFKLKELQGYSDISSLKDARYAIIGEFIEQKGYPLWSLEYMTEDFINSMPRLTMNEDVKNLINNIQAICVEKDQKNVQLVTNTLNLIKSYSADFPDILNKPDSFKNGFNNYLFIQEVELHDYELEDVYKYIKNNVKSTVGFWEKDEVTKNLLRWRVEQREKIERERREKEEAERRKREEEIRIQNEEERKKNEIEIERAKKIIGNKENIPHKKSLALQYINSLKEPNEFRNVLTKVIDLEYESILNIILENKGNDA